MGHDASLWRRALEYIPIDLNSLLYKYEIDFAKTARLFGDKRRAAAWETTARHRKTTINELMWDNGRGLYYDYNYVKEKRGNVSSLASYYALWSGLADEEQAKNMLQAIKRFENKGGLATTDSLPIGQYVLGSVPTQWAYPNGWAPLHFITVKGLQQYGFNKDAARIAMKWLKTNLYWFERNNIVSWKNITPSSPINHQSKEFIQVRPVSAGLIRYLKSFVRSLLINRLKSANSV